MNKPATTTQSQKRERPILFSGSMVRATLADLKHQTRRIINPQPTNRPIYATPETTIQCKEAHWLDADGIHPGVPMKCKQGKPGDLLWVKETFSAHGAFAKHGTGRVNYRADKADGKEPSGLHWKPSIFMQRWASRITLEITAIRVERLQDISEEDAIAEGCFRIQESGHTYFANHQPPPAHGRSAHPIDAYRILWESINGPGSWDANPYVWVIEFKKL